MLIIYLLCTYSCVANEFRIHKIIVQIIQFNKVAIITNSDNKVFNRSNLSSFCYFLLYYLLLIIMIWPLSFYFIFLWIA